MAKMLLRNIRSGQRKAAITDLKSIGRKELEQTLETQVKQRLIEEHKKVTANWEHDIEFQGRKTITADQIKIYIFPAGPNKEIWNYNDQGTRPHVIRPKSAPRLAFQAGTYIPKTKPVGQIVSGGGQVQGGELVFAKEVNHPGTEARRFSETIAEDIKPDFRREVENAFRRIARLVEE